MNFFVNICYFPIGFPPIGKFAFPAVVLLKKGYGLLKFHYKNIHGIHCGEMELD
jgi:hypothetical protein